MEWDFFEHSNTAPYELVCEAEGVDMQLTVTYDQLIEFIEDERLNVCIVDIFDFAKPDFHQTREVTAHPDILISDDLIWVLKQYAEREYKRNKSGIQPFNFKSLFNQLRP